MSRLASLTARLVLTTVALVALVSVLLATLTTVAMRAFLDDRLDDDVREAFAQRVGERPDPDEGPQRYAGVGSLSASFVEDGTRVGQVVVPGERGRDAPGPETLDDDELEPLGDVPTDGDPHDVELPDHGRYRVLARTVQFELPGGGSAAGVLVVGLPTDDVDDTVASLVGWEVALALLGTAAAGLVGLVVVRRQMRPLREVAATAERVAELPLASGETRIAERVQSHLTDEATEVGQVGASLNTLLDHVESSLAARHRSEQQVRQFVADASHELRTPLTTIKGYAELARRRPDDLAAVRTALDKVEAESGRMTSLVEDLLLLARLDAGRALAREPVDLTRLLLEAVSDARVVAPDHHWRLRIPDAVVTVTGDEQRLHQLVTNLLTNARRHTPPGTTVTVSVGPGVVTVHDDGPGFPPELVPHAFERFARGDSSRTRTRTGAALDTGAAGGAGLGLSLVQAIAAAHGGTVSLSSVPGDTTVAVRLPVGSSAEVAAGATR